MTDWSDVPVSPGHRTLLKRSAITADIASRVIRTVETAGQLPDEFALHRGDVVPALLFTWTSPGGVKLPQLRPDDDTAHRADETAGKYLFPPGSTPVFDVHPMITDRLAADAPVLIVEGTKQHLAAVSHVRELPHLVLGMAGCYGWSVEGTAISDFDALTWENREVVLMLDADLAHNRDVWDGAKGLTQELMIRGAAAVRYAHIPDHGDCHRGLDDVLGNIGDPAKVLSRLVGQAEKKMPAKPKPRRTGDGAAFFNQSTGKFLPDDFHEALSQRRPMALAKDGFITVYRDGVYHAGGDAHRRTAFAEGVRELLGNDTSKHVTAEAEHYASARLYGLGRLLPERMREPVLNCSNGLLDLRTGELTPHDPGHLSSSQLPVAWRQDAVCPSYEQWLKSQAGEQGDDLEEVASTMLDPSATAPKAMLLFGPTRSGKSTFLRLAEAIAGPANYSAVTLHQLADDPFATANLYGKMLNSAADLSSAHVSNLSAFKTMTGDDPIHANRKYGQQFTFTNQALFAFCANEVPTVGEASSAYAQRIKPFRFDKSFAGSENRAVEDAMRGELEGILVRWVAAWQRLQARGSYRGTDPDVQREFEQSSDRVARWVAETCRIVKRYPVGGSFRDATPSSKLPPTHATAKTATYRRFTYWADESGSPKMGRNKFYDRLTSIDGVYEVRIQPSGSRGFNVVEAGGEEPVGGNNGSFTPHTTGSRDLFFEGEGGVNISRTYGMGGKTAIVAEPAAPPRPPGASSGRVVFDVETGGSDLHSAGSGGFVRLCGYRTVHGENITPDAGELVSVLENSGEVVGHNILAFDLPALHLHHGLDFEKLVAEDRVRDTKLLAALNDPPHAGMGSGRARKHYSLDSVGERLLGIGKTDDLARLAEKHGGFDAIPVDDPEYREYLRGDVDVSARLVDRFEVSDYAKREHRVAAIAAKVSLNGFAVDEKLLHERITEGQERKTRLLSELTGRYGLPAARPNGTFYRSPHATKAGKAALIKAFGDLGIPAKRIPTTPKGDPSLGKEALTELRANVAERVPARKAAPILDLVDTVLELNGVRTIYQTIADNVTHGRVHPDIEMLQASGRWSITDPGLTVMGKSGGRYVERMVMLPDPGEVIVTADLSQVDARVIAALSQDHAYMGLFEPGMDNHTEIAKQVWGDVSRRQDAKKIGHAWNYGASVNRLAAMPGVTREAVTEFDRAMTDRFPRLVEWRDEVREQAKAGELLDNGFGRLMRAEPHRAWTQAPALMGQGGTRDILMEGLLRLPRDILPMVRTVVHDEVVLSIPQEQAGWFGDDGEYHPGPIEQVVLQSLSFEWRGIRIDADPGKRPGASWGEVYA